MTYATDQEVALAEELGYTWTKNQQRGHHFEKGNRRIWGIAGGWQTADLIDGRYQNHQGFAYLQGALQRPLTEE